MPTIGRSAPDFDLVIRNGRVLDGAGNPWVAGDVAVREGRLAQVGRVVGRGVREIDAAGRYVAPGFIDMMDQSGRVLMEGGLAPNKVMMGVTTCVAGELGAPVPSDRIDGWLGSLEGRISVNFGSYYNATHARREVMGDGAGVPTAAELADMQLRVCQAMRQGALGLTTALVYPPAAFHTTDELVELARVAAAYGGIYASHVRDESAGLVDGVAEAIQIGEQARIPVEVYHFKAAWRPGAGEIMPQACALIDAARQRGVSIGADVYPYVAAATGLEVVTPTWVFADGKAAALARLADPVVRERLKREIEAGATAEWSNYVAASGGWENIRLAQAHNETYDAYRFESLATIGRRLGRHPADVAWDIMLESQPARPLALYFMMSEEDVETAIRRPWTSIGSDAAAALALGELDGLSLPHPRSYGTFARVLAKYVRDRQVLTLEDAVRKMTSWPAMRMGFGDRGVIRQGLWADLVVFDLDGVEDKADWANPTAAARGFDYVIVNGALVVDEGVHTGATPGRVLRGPGAGEARLT